MLSALSDEDILLKISNRLKQIRKETGMSQDEAAKKSGISRYTLSNIENGKPFNIDTFIRLLRVYGMLSLLDGLDKEPIRSIKDKFRDQ